MVPVLLAVVLATGCEQVETCLAIGTSQPDGSPPLGCQQSGDTGSQRARLDSSSCVTDILGGPARIGG
jgi:hypothetical protein